MDGILRMRGVTGAVEAFDEFALGGGTEASAMACVRIRKGDDVQIGVAFAEDTASAALQAVLTALGRQPGREIEAPPVESAAQPADGAWQKARAS
jgi:2-isopropylmalate synthase